MQDIHKQLKLTPEAGFDIEVLERAYIEKTLRLRHEQLTELGKQLIQHSTRVASAVAQKPPKTMLDSPLNIREIEEKVANTAVSLMRICAVLGINLDDAIEDWQG